jgi:hypothetical protein
MLPQLERVTFTPEGTEYAEYAEYAVCYAHADRPGGERVRCTP